MPAGLGASVDRLVETLNDLRPVPEDPVCNADQGATYDLILAYPEGVAFAISLEGYGCHTVRAGDAYRVGGSQVIQTMARLVEEQHITNPLDPPPAPPACSEVTRDRSPRYDELTFFLPTTAGMHAVHPAVAVAICRFETADPGAELLGRQEVTGEPAARLKEILLANSDPEASMDDDCWSSMHYDPVDPLDVLLFVDAAGGVYEVWVDRGDECPAVWASRIAEPATPELRAAIDELMGGPPPAPSGSAPPEETAG